MAVEDQVRDLLHAATPYPPVGLDGAAVARSARRRHRRRVALAALPAMVVVLALVAGGTALLGRSHQQRSGPPAGPAGGWHRIADLPVPARYSPLVAWTGHEALVVGGLDARTVGPGQDTTPLADGAAYDPEADSWREIAPAPTHLSSDDDTAFADGTLVVAHEGRLLAYDVAADTWRELPAPPQDVHHRDVAAQDGLVYLLGASAGGGYALQVLDLATGSWSELPRDPDLPEAYLPTLVPTPSGLVVMGDGMDRASADVWDGSSWTHYDTDLRGGLWHWTGGRVISGYLASKRSATPSAAFDPATGAWSALPWLPVDRPTSLWSGGTIPTAGALVLSDSTLYDDRSGTFTPVRPPVASLTSPGLLLEGRTLLAFGGYVPRAGHEHDTTPPVATTVHAWAYEVP